MSAWLQFFSTLCNDISLDEASKSVYQVDPQRAEQTGDGVLEHPSRGGLVFYLVLHCPTHNPIGLQSRDNIITINAMLQQRSYMLLTVATALTCITELCWQSKMLMSILFVIGQKPNDLICMWVYQFLLIERPNICKFKQPDQIFKILWPPLKMSLVVIVRIL